MWVKREVFGFYWEFNKNFDASGRKIREERRYFTERSQRFWNHGYEPYRSC